MTNEQSWSFQSDQQSNASALRIPLLVGSGYNLKSSSVDSLSVQTDAGPVIINYRYPYPEIIFQSVDGTEDTAMQIARTALAQLQVIDNANLFIPIELSEPQPINDFLSRTFADQHWPNDPDVKLSFHTDSCIARKGERIVIVSNSVPITGISGDFSTVGNLLAQRLSSARSSLINEERVFIACQLFASALATMNRISRFIQLVTVLETLSNEESLSNSARDWLNELTRTLPEDLEDREYIANNLRNLRKPSITKGIVSLVTEHYSSTFGSADEHLFINAIDVNTKVRTIYGLRSKLVHSGSANLNFFDFLNLIALTRRICHELLLARILPN